MSWATVLLTLMLAVSPLQEHADRHVVEMADADRIYHSDLSVLLWYCDWAGENVGVGTTPQNVDAALDASPGHHALRVYPWDEMAQSVYERDGLVWIVEVFCVRAEPGVVSTPELSETDNTHSTVPVPFDLDAFMARFDGLGFVPV